MTHDPTAAGPRPPIPGDAEPRPDRLARLEQQADRFERAAAHDVEQAARDVEQAVHDAGRIAIPAWRRVTRGERRWPFGLAVLTTIALQLALPGPLTVGQRWVLPVVETVMLVALALANPGRVERGSARLRVFALLLIAVVSLANAWSVGQLVVGLVRGTGTEDAATLLLSGGDIWLTNVVVFGIWYWELDRGGPAARAQGEQPYPDLLFPQMDSPGLAPEDWEPRFADYLYVSFTNATAFSPTDTLPLTHWAKFAMMLQSAVSLATAALVIARAVNILGP